MKTKPSRQEMIAAVQCGKAASYAVGSDTYGSWISEVHPDKFYFGTYRPNLVMEKDWTDGNMVADPFDSSKLADTFYIAYRGKWWEFDPHTGRRSQRSVRLFFDDTPHNYRDPSF